MPAELLVQLIVQVGLPLALKLADMCVKEKDVTQEDLDTLRAAATQLAEDRVKAMLVKAGIELDSEQGKSMLSLAVG